MIRDLYAGNGIHERPLYAPQMIAGFLHSHLPNPLVRSMGLGDERPDVDVHVDSGCVSNCKQEIHKGLLFRLYIDERKADHEIEFCKLPSA